jgi:hypothetical protein
MALPFSIIKPAVQLHQCKRSEILVDIGNY